MALQDSEDVWALLGPWGCVACKLIVAVPDEPLVSAAATAGGKSLHAKRIHICRVALSILRLHDAVLAIKAETKTEDMSSCKALCFCKLHVLRGHEVHGFFYIPAVAHPRSCSRSRRDPEIGVKISRQQ